MRISFWGLPKFTCFHKTLKSISVCKSRNYRNSASRWGSLGTSYKSIMIAVRGFRLGRVIVPFLRRKPHVFPQVRVTMNLKPFDVLLDNKLSVIRWYLFCFLLVLCWRGKMTSASRSSLRSFHIYRKQMEDRNVRFYIKRKGQYSTIAFCVNLAQLFILSYLTTRSKMFPSKNTRALICFSSTIDENTNTIHLIEGFVF